MASKLMRMAYKIMISTAIHASHSDSWQQMTPKLAKIAERPQTRQQKQQISGQMSLRTRKLSRFEITETLMQGIEEQRILSNRLKFIESEKQRNLRTLQMARRKYEKVMQVRTQAMREKQQCANRLQQTQKQQAKDVSSRAGKVRQERSRVVQSVQKVRDNNKLGAKELRSLSLQFEDGLKLERQVETEYKKSLVVKVQTSLSESRTFLNIIQQQRIKRGRANHRDYLQQKLQVNNVQQRHNSILKQKLHQSLMNASKDKEACLIQLRNYQVITPKYKSKSLRKDSKSLLN